MRDFEQENGNIASEHTNFDQQLDLDKEIQSEKTEADFENSREDSDNSTGETYRGAENPDETPFCLNKVNFTPAGAYNGNKTSGVSKGIKVFSVILASVILLTAVCVIGYSFGLKQSLRLGTVSVDLSAKPKDKDPYTVAQVYEKVNKSIVGIRVYNQAGKMSDVTGIVYSGDGYIISNDHMYSSIPSPMFKVFMYDGTEYDAEYVAGDLVSDLAVIKIKGSVELNVPEFGNPEEMACGESVAVIGRPSDAAGKTAVTSGVISLLGRRVKTKSGYSASLIQTDSAINPGNSGGALCNMYGQVIGVTSSKLIGSNYESFGFAIPSTTVKRVTDQLIKNGKVTDRAKLGITYTEINSVTGEIMGYSNTGLLVNSVSSDSDISGKIVAGDVITGVNGISVTSDDILLDIIEMSRAGDTITLTVVTKSGISKDIEATLKANIGESSYSTADPFASSSNSDSDSGESSSDSSNLPKAE